MLVVFLGLRREPIFYSSVYVSSMFDSLVVNYIPGSSLSGGTLEVVEQQVLLIFPFLLNYSATTILTSHAASDALGSTASTQSSSSSTSRRQRRFGARC
jgi:cytochrome bd-type quinol oxidase subunit 2